MLKWRTKKTKKETFCEEKMTDYLSEHILKHRFSRCHSVPGKPTAARQVNMCSGCCRVACGWRPAHLHASHTVPLYRTSGLQQPRGHEQGLEELQLLQLSGGTRNRAQRVPPPPDPLLRERAGKLSNACAHTHTVRITAHACTCTCVMHLTCIMHNV